MEENTSKRVAMFLSQELPTVISKGLFKDKKHDFIKDLASLGNEGNDWQQKKVSIAHQKTNN